MLQLSPLFYIASNVGTQLKNSPNLPNDQQVAVDQEDRSKETKAEERAPEKHDLSELEKIEINHIYETITKIQDRRVQVFSFFATANLTLLALAFQEKSSGLLLIGIGFLLLYLSTEMTFRAEFAPYLVRGYIIEKSIDKGTSHLVTSIMHIMEHHFPFVEKLEEILEESENSDPREIGKRISWVLYKPFGFKKSTFALGIGAILIESGIWAWLHFYLSWKLF